MEAFHHNLSVLMSFLSVTSIVAATIFIFLVYFRGHKSGNKELPPGKMGLPLVGETWEFLSCGWKGDAKKYVMDRLNKYTPHKVFKTSIFGENMMVMCGAEANKFIFSNESKLVKVWWPESIQRILTPDFKEEEIAMRLRKLLQPFFMPEALQRYIPIMDSIANQHFEKEWEGKDKVKVVPLAKSYTFLLACHIFISIKDSTKVAEMFATFNNITSGLISLPINFPGTNYNRGLKASKVLKKELKDIILQRKVDLVESKASPTQDIISQIMLAFDEDGRYMNETDLANNILAIFVAGYDTSSSVCALIVKHLAELPHIYELVYKEQMEIARSKVDGELLNWEDTQTMKYSWNVACEVLRINPTTSGVFREVIKDFNFENFQIPKSWKILSSTFATHWSPECFPLPEKFDPSRFQGDGPEPYTFVPFGGGRRKCLGMEYARLLILVFMYNLVKRFKWEKVVPNEIVIMNPFSIPAKGLPIYLYPHPQASSRP